MDDGILTRALPHDAREGGLKGATAVIVMGMHRSGTSALAGMLHHLGVELGGRLMQASPDNPRGYWEHLDVVAVTHNVMAKFGRGWDDIRPLPPGYQEAALGHEARRQLSAILLRDFAGVGLWGLKDPRLCRLTALLHPVFGELGIEPRFILMLRHPSEVAASLAARDGLSAERALLLWLRHTLEAERGTRGHKRTIVHYEDLVGRDLRNARSSVYGRAFRVRPRAYGAATTGGRAPRSARPGRRARPPLRTGGAASG